jgi:hypothetical protein
MNKRQEKELRANLYKVLEPIRLGIPLGGRLEDYVPDEPPILRLSVERIMREIRALLSEGQRQVSEQLNELLREP